MLNKTKRIFENKTLGKEQIDKIRENAYKKEITIVKRQGRESRNKTRKRSKKHQNCRNERVDFKHKLRPNGAVGTLIQNLK